MHAVVFFCWLKMKDRKRIFGPEASIPLPTQASVRSRLNHTMRPIFCQPTGSGLLFEQGSIKIFTRVYKRFKGFNTSLKFSNFALQKRRSFVPDDLEKQYSGYLNSALLPVIMMDLVVGVDVYVFVIESDGQMATLAAAITSASLALAYAQVPMLGLVAASSIGIDKNGELVLDVEQGQENSNAEMVLSTSKAGNVTFMVQFKQSDLEMSRQMIEYLTDASQQLIATIEQLLINL